MAPFATLHGITSVPHPRIHKCHAIAKMNGLELDSPPSFEYGVSNQSPEFLAKWPLGKIPTLETSSGLLLSESSAIAFFLAESGPKKDQLLGVDIETRGKIQQWTSFGDNELTAILALALEIWGRPPFNTQDWDDNVKALHRALKVVDDHVRSREWLVGDQLSMADLAVASWLCLGFAYVIDEEMRERYKAVTQWYLKVLESDAVKGAIPKLDMIQKVVKPQKSTA